MLFVSLFLLEAGGPGRGAGRGAVPRTLCPLFSLGQGWDGLRALPGPVWGSSALTAGEEEEAELIFELIYLHFRS